MLSQQHILALGRAVMLNRDAELDATRTERSGPDYFVRSVIVSQYLVDAFRSDLRRYLTRDLDTGLSFYLSTLRGHEDEHENILAMMVDCTPAFFPDLDDTKRRGRSILSRAQTDELLAVLAEVERDASFVQDDALIMMHRLFDGEVLESDQIARYKTD